PPAGEGTGAAERELAKPAPALVLPILRLRRPGYRAVHRRRRDLARCSPIGGDRRSPVDLGRARAWVPPPRPRRSARGGARSLRCCRPRRLVDRADPAEAAVVGDDRPGNRAPGCCRALRLSPAGSPDDLHRVPAMSNLLPAARPGGRGTAPPRVTGSARSRPA